MKLRTLLHLIRKSVPFRHRLGYCPVCGKCTIFIVAEPPQLIRNHAVCAFCHSSSRNRHVALSILSVVRDRGIRKLSDISHDPGLVVLNTASTTPIAKALGHAPNVHNTEFYDGVPSGSFRDGIECQDLEKLSYADNSIDLIISEDVLEHVRDIQAVLTEIRRVLKPSGHHVFSIPYLFDKRTERLFDFRNGEFVPVVEPIEYHGDSVRGRIPATYRFGYDLLDQLRDSGLPTRISISQYDEYGRYGTWNSFTFVSEKTR